MTVWIAVQEGNSLGNPGLYVHQGRYRGHPGDIMAAWQSRQKEGISSPSRKLERPKTGLISYHQRLGGRPLPPPPGQCRPRFCSVPSETRRGSHEEKRQMESSIRISLSEYIDPDQSQWLDHSWRNEIWWEPFPLAQTCDIRLSSCCSFWFCQFMLLTWFCSASSHRGCTYPGQVPAYQYRDRH